MNLEFTDDVLVAIIHGEDLEPPAYEFDDGPPEEDAGSCRYAAASVAGGS